MFLVDNSLSLRYLKDISLPTPTPTPTRAGDKRRRQSKQSEHEHADNHPDWEPVPLHDLSLETSLYANFEPQKCIIPLSWYWIESND
jgi:hypothetical protein